ncbi:MAG TPA: acetyl-CoA carboxylase carboxyltransferase subunit alpha, partial [Thermogutta sp.]|nr:acetyl-CoA carboxylase carboxyltransferase subunit alpha [Thermogutta sp.]
MATEFRLAFERPIYELESRIEKLERLAQTDPNVREELQQKRLELVELKKQIYSNLKPWEVVEVARHPDRPKTSDYLQLTFDEFVELHGDRCFGDDRAIRTGWAKLDMFKVMVIGHEKGKTTKERLACNYGCAHPEGYRKAMAKAKLAAKFHLPIICLIDTPGAYPGIGAEERGQAQVIAESMFLMSQLPTPIICVVIGEGGSGGALAIGVGDRVAMLEHAYYSVISPEGCAGILWKDRQYKEEAARARDLEERRRKALAEAEAIRNMINTPSRVMTAKKPEETPKAAKGTLHKPAAVAKTEKPAGATKVSAVGANKEVKSAKLSSSWA